MPADTESLIDFARRIDMSDRDMAAAVRLGSTMTSFAHVMAKSLLILDAVDDPMAVVETAFALNLKAFDVSRQGQRSGRIG